MSEITDAMVRKYLGHDGETVKVRIYTYGDHISPANRGIVRWTAPKKRVGRNNERHFRRAHGKWEYVGSRPEIVAKMLKDGFSD